MLHRGKKHSPSFFDTFFRAELSFLSFLTFVSLVTFCVDFSYESRFFRVRIPRLGDAKIGIKLSSAWHDAQFY